MAKINMPFLFRVPKVYTWEDVRKQILENMEREGLPIDGVSVGTAADVGAIAMIAQEAAHEITFGEDVSIRRAVASWHGVAYGDYVLESERPVVQTQSAYRG